MPMTSTYHAITPTPTPARPCVMHCHQDDNTPPPATWNHRWRTTPMPVSAFEDLCEACASELRRREVCGELRAIGAWVIRVKDLGDVDLLMQIHCPPWSDVRGIAHKGGAPYPLARLALGEG